MKNLFYATRLDKEGNKLTTSYTNKKMADQYGGAGSVVQETLYGINFGANLIHEGEIGTNIPIIRSLLVNNGEVGSATSDGRFKLYARIKGEWEDLNMSFSNYGAANALMKAIIGQYEALVIVTSADLEDNRPAPQELTVGIL